MPIYKAPVEDVSFLLNDVFQIDRYDNLPGFSDASADVREAILGEAAKLVLLSYDSTLRSNLSVGMPIDILVYERDSLDVKREKRIAQDDEYFKNLSSAWSEALRQAFAKIDEFKV